MYFSYQVIQNWPFQEYSEQKLWSMCPLEVQATRSDISMNMQFHRA